MGCSPYERSPHEPVRRSAGAGDGRPPQLRPDSCPDWPLLSRTPQPQVRPRETLSIGRIVHYGRRRRIPAATRPELFETGLLPNVARRFCPGRGLKPPPAHSGFRLRFRPRAALSVHHRVWRRVPVPIRAPGSFAARSTETNGSARAGGLLAPDNSCPGSERKRLGSDPARPPGCGLAGAHRHTGDTSNYGTIARARQRLGVTPGRLLPAPPSNAWWRTNSVL